MRKIIRIITVLAALVLSAIPCSASDFIELRVPCSIGGTVSAVMPDGGTVQLGRVLMTPSKTNWPAYTASKWCAPSTVCASAVNAVHLLAGVEKGRGRIISLVPSVTIAPAAAQGAFFSLDMQAGTGIFGGFAPLVGSAVSIEGIDGGCRVLDGVPRAGEMLVIRSPLPRSPGVYMVDIENRPLGRVTAWSPDGVKVAARVIRPVGGVGRFGGTQFQGTGRIRASHAGVIDIATAPRGQVGGIQIMPLIHALTSPEMASAWKLTQWMIIAPTPGDAPLAGREPLFRNSLLPGTQMSDDLGSVWSTFGRRPLAMCRLNGGAWTRFPEAAGKDDNALRDITHIRIYFPFWEEPQIN